MKINIGKYCRNIVVSLTWAVANKYIRHARPRSPERMLVHIENLVPTAGLEPAQVAPLAPQTSASTNSATSASSATQCNSNPNLVRRRRGLRRRARRGRRAPARGGASRGDAPCGAGGAERRRRRRRQALSPRAAPLRAPRPRPAPRARAREVGSAGERVPMYASVKLVTKNSAANTAVNFENKVAVPRAPNTVPDAPEPNPAPASAPFPALHEHETDDHQRKQNVHRQNETTQHVDSLNVARPPPRKSAETHRRSTKRRPPIRRPHRASRTARAAFDALTLPPYRIRTLTAYLASCAAIRLRRYACTSCACCGEALRPVPIAQTGS